MSTNVRVRFAPSPTGYLHIGGVRTALYNYLFAKQNKGTFILRIEDTDQARYVAAAEEYIINSLKWVGIEPDESPQNGGDFGPYRQSERKALYQKYVQELLDNHKAYYAFDTPEELDVMREKLKAAGSSHQQYDATTRGEMKNSLTLSAEETKAWMDAGKPYVVRFKMPKGEQIVLNDLVRGEVTFNSDQLDDKVLMKGDGMPTYHLANIVDDHLMEISHVIRGEEWLPSTPLHHMLYRAFEWKAPQYAHLPLILKPEGKGKLSKRDGEKHGFPVFPLQWYNEEKQMEQPGFKEIGFIPEAFNNMIAFFGWNPGTEQELFSNEELIKEFSIDRIQKSGARFDWEKAKWYNQQYLHQQSNENILSEVKQLFPNLIAGKTDEYVLTAIEMVKERMTFVLDFEQQAAYLFNKPSSYDEKNVKKRYKPNNVIHFENLVNHFAQMDTWSSEQIESDIKSFLEKNELGFGAILPGFRLMLSGVMGGPHVYDIAEIIGKEETIERMNTGINKFGELIA